MIENRGFNINFVPNLSFNEFNSIYDNFTNYSETYDILVQQNSKKIYAKFIKSVNSSNNNTNGIKKGQNKSAIKELKELDLFIRKYHNLDTEDNIIFIICYGDKSHEIHNSFESKSSFIQLFHINRLQFNITKHNLVPKHEIISIKDKNFLKKKFKFKSIYQLPKILVNDPICKFIGAKIGDVIKIHRNSKNAGIHLCYRICISV